MRTAAAERAMLMLLVTRTTMLRVRTQAVRADCAVGDGRCEGQSFERCGADNHWQRGSACKFVCDPSEGCTGSCTPGTLKCQSTNHLDICSNEGQFEQSEACDLACAVVSGQAECVECTGGDGLCVGGCTPQEDSDCPAETGIHQCPNVYFGLGRYKSPQPKEFQNTSIGVSKTLAVGTTLLVAITLSNHGTDDSPPTSLELYWGDPTDGCLRHDQNRIGNTVNFVSVPGAITNPAIDGQSGTGFGWTPDAAALNTNGGHVCLLAVAYNTQAPTGAGCVQQSNNSLSPATDPLSAVAEIQVVPAKK